MPEAKKMRHNGAEIVIKLLEREGIDLVSGIPGGANLPLYNALHKSPIRHVLARHEQGAGFIAHGMARSTGKTAVCFATSGPGVTNLVTALADAKLDSVPIVAFTGQVATAMIGTDAFQEVDTYGMTLPITKHNFLVRNTRELLTIVPRAFQIAASGRPGPVVVDLPKDVQLEEIDIVKWPQPGSAAMADDPDTRSIRRAADLVNKSKRPVIYAGGGITASRREDLLVELARKNNIPVAVTLMALGCFPPDDPLYLGMLGMHGAVSTNLTLDRADLILVLGARFDDRAVGRVKDFCPGAKIVHVDIDAAEIHKIRHADLPIVGDAGRVMEEMLPLVAEDTRSDWMRQVAAFRSTFPFDPTRRRGRHPIDAIRAAASMVPHDTVVCTDVGQHQMWVAQGYPFTRPRTFLTSGGLGTMGFGLPAAIGAALARPGRRVLCFSGDGSLQMNIQELATLGELGLPVTVLVLNNGHLGLVRQQQEMFYDRNFIASKFDVDLDFAAIARQFGVPGYKVGLGEPFAPVLAAALAEPGPSVVDLAIHHLENVLPMVPPGKANRDMIGTDGFQVNS
jgi:acetolactate synthase-1/2/3 large subunit